MMRNKQWYRTTYLKSPHWRTFSKKQLSKRLVCEECLKNPATELHHRYYYDLSGHSILGREKPSTVTAICRDCHNELESFKKVAKKKKLKKRLTLPFRIW